MAETEAPEKTEVDPTSRPTSAKAWANRASHNGITLPSGAIVDIKLPNLAAMVKSGTIPNELVEIALKQRNEEITKESLIQGWDFARFIVPKTVVKPEIAEEDVDGLPIEDVELIAQFAGRQTDIDAVGHHLAGLETVKSFRRHRGIFSVDEIVGGDA